MDRMEIDLISVIVPIYNIEQYLRQCIDSLICQTYLKLEILLVDDGSTDSSGAICDEYQLMDSRITVFHKENGGLSDARNYGIDRAHGRYIAFVDGDDWVHPQMYEILYSIIRKNNADIASCGFERDDEEFGKYIVDIESIKYRLKSRYDILSNYMVEDVCACNKLYKGELFRSIRFPVGRLHEDEFIAHRINYLCTKWLVIDYSLYFYTKRSGSIMSTINEKNYLDAIEAHKDRIQFFKEGQLVDLSHELILKFLDYLVNSYFYLTRVLKNKNREVITILRKSEKYALKEYKGICIPIKYKLFSIHPFLCRIWNRINMNN